MTVSRAEHVVVQHWRVCPTCADGLAGVLESTPGRWPELEAELRATVPRDTEQTLVAMDAAVEGRCAGPGCGVPLTADGPSGWWCSPACQAAYQTQGAIRPHEVRGSTGVAADPARWRPDLVDTFDDSELELIGEEPRTHAEGSYRWYRHVDGRRFLRLDDGNRWVGAFAELADGPQVELWRRLERELADPRRLDPDPDPAWSAVAQYGSALFDRWLNDTRAEAEGRRRSIITWLRANGIDPDWVPIDANIVCDGRTIRCDMIRHTNDGTAVLVDGAVVWDQVSVPMTVPPGREAGVAFDGASVGPASAQRVRIVDDPAQAEMVAVDPANGAAGAVFWMADPPADPEAPTMAELERGINLTPYLAPARDTFRRVGERLLGEGGLVARPIAAYQNLPEATRAAVEAEQDRVALRALCSDEAEYERALQAGRDNGLSVREVSEMLAAGQALGPEGFSTSALDHLMDAGAIDSVGIMTTAPPPPTGEDIMANIRAFSEQLADHNPAVRFVAGRAVIESLPAQAPRNRAPGAPLGGLGDVPIVPDPTLAAEEWRLEYANGQRLESHICRWELIGRASSDWTRPWRRVSRYRCSLRWSDGTRCDSTTTDPSTVRRTERLVGPSATGGRT